MEHSETVQEAANRMWPDVSYDTALPQGWVNTAIKQGFDPRGQVVWGYPKHCCLGIPLPLTPEAQVYLVSGADHWRS